MPVANPKAPTDPDDSDLSAWSVDDKELDALARRIATADRASVASLFEQLGVPAARRLGKELRRRADSNPAKRPIYDRAVTELMCADLACERPNTKLPKAEETDEESQGIGVTETSSVD